MRINALAVWVFVAVSCAADTHVADSASYADVNAAISAAENGDTVTIPAGASNWASQLVIDKAITLQGAGASQTLITNATADYLVDVTLQSSGLFRLTGIGFYGTDKSQVYVTSSNFRPGRIDNCAFHTNNIPIMVEGHSAFLIDQNTFNDGNYVFRHLGSDDSSWALSVSDRIGTTNAVVCEDNVVNITLPDSWVFSSGGQGMFRCIRYNTINNSGSDADSSPLFDAHGNQCVVIGQDWESDPEGGTSEGGSSGVRGTRVSEIYRNTYSDTGSPQADLILAVDVRGGWNLVWSNAFSCASDSAAGSLRIREEDTTDTHLDAEDVLTEFPGYDMPRLWLWGNTKNGSSAWNNASAITVSDPDFIVEGTNLFFEAKSGYTPLRYPHPLRGTTRRITAGTVNAGTVRGP